MRALRALGLRVSIDDFGTGYSSFSYLASLPFDTLKIDKSFLCGIERDYRRALVLEAIVTLAHKLGISVVAEGIEDAAQLAAVRSLGCDHAQGYLLGMPELPERMDRGRCLTIPPPRYHVRGFAVRASLYQSGASGGAYPLRRRCAGASVSSGGASALPPGFCPARESREFI